MCFINGMMMDTNIRIFDHIKSNSYTIMLSSEFYKNNNLHREDAKYERFPEDVKMVCESDCKQWRH